MSTDRRQFREDAVIGAMFAALLAGSVPVATAQPQSLGELANSESERRTDVPADRVYTNADLVEAPPPAAAPTRAGADPSTPGSLPAAVPGAASETASDAKPEPTGEPAGNSISVETTAEFREAWAARTDAVRERLAKTNADISAAEARLRQIDAALPTPTLTREHEVVAATLDRLRREARTLDDDLARRMTRLESGKTAE